jgi:4,5-dihydroxyphthalate decarboxylase
VVPLFPDADALDRAQYERTGIVPAFTLVAVKSAVLDQHSWLTEALYDAFVSARGYGLQPDPHVAEIVEGDPVPVGLSANRASFEELLALGREQHILDNDLTVDDLFPALG